MGKTGKRIIFRETGRPENVLQVEDFSAKDPANKEVLVRMQCAPINPADINFVEGTYEKKPSLPAVPGSEGVGVVEECGPEATSVRVGDKVILPAGAGTWASHLTIEEDGLIKVPAEIDLQQAAMLRVNPATAYRMIKDFQSPGHGDWLIQNAANSGVGMSVIAIARKLGIRTVNVVRREELVGQLEKAGADIVILDSREAFKSVADLTGGAKIRLGLNAVGGDSAIGVASCLSNGGTMVTYGAMSKQALKIPNGFLIFKDIRFNGFWLTRWLDNAPRDEIRAMFDELAALVCDGILRVPVDSVYSLHDVREAVIQAQKGERDGKVIFDLQAGI